MCVECVYSVSVMYLLFYVFLLPYGVIKNVCIREAERPGLEPATSRLQDRRPNHYATRGNY